MNQNLWYEPAPCFGKDPDTGLVPRKRERKKTIKRRQACLFLALVGLTVYCLYMTYTPSTEIDSLRWGVGSLFSAVSALIVLFYNNRRRHRRGRYGTYD